MAKLPPQIANGDFEKRLAGWHVVSGKAFAGQPVAAAKISSADVEVDGRPIVPLGGDYWHTTRFPIGQSGDSLIRVVTKAGGILDSSPFTVSQRWLAFRLGGSAGGGVGLELRVPAATAKAKKRKVLDKPDADGYVAVRIELPTGSDPLTEFAWDLFGKEAKTSLQGEPAKIRLRVTATKRVQRLLVDAIRLEKKRPPPFRRPLWGWADIHCHPMAQAGFGSLLSGHMHGPLEDVGSCLPMHGYMHRNPLRPASLALEHAPRHNDGSLATTGWTTGTPPSVDDELGFRGWPAFDEVIHIKTHQAWIRRAYEGGQRLMVALVVHNQMLAGITNAITGVFEAQSDRDTVEPQVQMLREFVVHNQDWCGLATKPEDARKLIADNKLAFVLGLETDSINNWVKASDFPEVDTPANRVTIHDRIHKYFGYLHDLGIVQVNLIHLSDNAFGGMAVYDLMFMVNSWQRTGKLPALEDGYFAHLNPPPDDTPDKSPDVVSRQVSVAKHLWSVVEPVVNAVGLMPPPPPPARPFPEGDRNVKGLTVAGEVALLEAMRHGMVIDMDHMSEHSADTAHDIATGQLVPKAPYPLVAAHNGARALAPRPLDKTEPARADHRRNPEIWPAESMRSEVHFGWINETKGMFGHGIAGADSVAFGVVPNDCIGSSKTFAQGYQYVASKLSMPVAFGTDWNALLGGPSPRFGMHAASGLEGEMGQGDATWQGTVRTEQLTNALSQRDGVRYTTPIRDWRSYRFPDTGLYDNTRAKDDTRFIWQALALLDSGADLSAPSVADALAEQGYPEAPALELAIGMARRPGLPGNVTSDFNRAGVVFTATPPIPVTGEVQHVQDLVEGLGAIRPLWQSMVGGTSPAMVRDTVGPMRDFDYNLDGLAHYGMLPDMLQDLRNVGLPTELIGELFQSAEEYIRVWERSVAAGSSIPHP